MVHPEVVMLLEVSFWLSALMIIYVYIGYPVCAYILSKIYNKKFKKGIFQPNVSILIAAYNEETCIGETIKNKLHLNYPKDKLDIIVISDESSDGTDKVVQQYSHERVLFLRQQPRAGKTAALNMAVPYAKGEILVFSDANSIYAVDALKHLVECFADNQVGYVTGKMIYVNPDGAIMGDGCSAYMKYENKLRDIETALGSVVGVDGGIDAMRKELYSFLRPDQLPDFVQPLKVVEKGFRVVYAQEALLREGVLQNAHDEYRMRVRVSLRALWALKDMRGLLKGTAGFMFAWQLWSHKVLRYLCFVFFVLLFVTNFFLLNTHWIYIVFFAFQLLGYLFALISPCLEYVGTRFQLIHFLRYFFLLNVASAHAFYKFFKGEKRVMWTPRKG
jgi:glycosyltransferase involved in cell wall biosynthesis